MFGPRDARIALAQTAASEETRQVLESFPKSPMSRQKYACGNFDDRRVT